MSSHHHHHHLCRYKQHCKIARNKIATNRLSIVSWSVRVSSQWHFKCVVSSKRHEKHSPKFTTGLPSCSCHFVSHIIRSSAIEFMRQFDCFQSSWWIVLCYFRFTSIKKEAHTRDIHHKFVTSITKACVIYTRLPWLVSMVSKTFRTTII